MKIYTVQRMDKYDYDFSVHLKKYGCFTDKESAKIKAKCIYEDICSEYGDLMEEYRDNNDMYDGALEIEEDDENGYYRVSFGFEEDYEVHNVAINEWNLELSHMDEYEIYRKRKREYLIEDIRAKAEEMEQDITGIDIERLVDYAERGIDNNDNLWESYWMSIEYALEHI